LNVALVGWEDEDQLLAGAGWERRNSEAWKVVDVEELPVRPQARDRRIAARPSLHKE
jgi:hypothetical protein